MLAPRVPQVAALDKNPAHHVLRIQPEREHMLHAEL